MEQVVSRDNMMAALHRVEANKGASGIDQMTVAQLRGHLRERALHQVLLPLYDPDFSDSSYGFRPGRSAHQAAQAARRYVAEGRRWVVDIDLEKFFDRVNHDILMSRLTRKVKDTRVLRITRRYLQAGVLEGGVVSPKVEGTPQGGPLSPLLSNILLDELDKELERRGHAFCRYAVDCNIYMQTRRGAQRVMTTLTRFLQERLELTVNAAKSAVDRPWNRTFLGYTQTFHRKPRLKVADKSVKRFKAKLRQVCRRGRGRSLGKVIEELTPKLRGWVSYFRLAEVKVIFEELDQWLRRKLRCILWRQWKRPNTRAKELMRRGLTEARAWQSATNGRGPWWNSGAAHMNDAVRKSYFERLGMISLIFQLRRFQRAL
jgi:group II intron reverse transcriptase/maturase